MIGEDKEIHPNVERLARQISAWKMGLVSDRLGQKLPDEVWRQSLTEALAELNGVQK